MRVIITAVALALLGSCTTTPTNQLAPALLDAPRRQNVPAILVLMPDSPAAVSTFEGLKAELGDDYDVVPRIVSDDTTPAQVTQHFRQVKPRAVVLMNNPTLRVYRRFQQTASDEQKKIPAVAVLTSFLRESSAGIQNITGVIYEVPLVTSLVNLRALLKQPVRRIGVIHRASFRGFIEEQRSLCLAEGFEIVAAEITGKQRREIRDAVDRLRETERVDAIWVLNDNALLDRDLILRGWLPALRRNSTPIVVNVKTLLSKKIDFGTFAVLPDHRALGTQTGQLISTLADRGWRVADQSFEYPLSVETVLDVEFARRHLEIEETALATVTELVE